MNTLEDDLRRARELSVDVLAGAIERIGFECTRCGACCKAADCGEEDRSEPHTATVFPDEVREIAEDDAYDWRDVARPMPYGLTEGGTEGETFEWALQTDGCGDCTFYSEGERPGSGECAVYGNRPLICRTYPFSVALDGSTQPMGEAIDQEGIVRVHECEGVGRDISREDAMELAETLKERAVRELEEAIAVTEQYAPVEEDDNRVIVHDSEGAKYSDGVPVEDSRTADDG